MNHFERDCELFSTPTHSDYSTGRGRNLLTRTDGIFLISVSALREKSEMEFELLTQ